MAEKYNSYLAKVNLLKKIDDAASQVGSTTSKARPSGMRDIGGAKSTAKNVLSSNKRGGLGKAELNKLDRESAMGGSKCGDSEAGRSLKSEYDYGSKRKFVDVLGNLQKSNAFNKDKPADTQSQRSRMSSLRGRNHTTLGNT